MIPYLFLAGFIFVINIIPAFIPPTWIILVFFYLKYHFSLIPLIIIGASSAAAGRIVLYFFAKNLFRFFLPEKSIYNLKSLGNFIQSHQNLTLSMILVYAFLPIPSNQTFIAAGLSGISIKLISFSFFIGRLISYTFWVVTSHKIADNLEGLFFTHLSNLGNIIIQIVGFAIIILISTINWNKFLPRKN